MRYLLAALCALVLVSYDMPKGWIRGGSRSDDYDMGTAEGEGRNKQNAATIKSLRPQIDGFGAMMQEFHPADYLGHRVRLTGYLKTKNVENWCGMFMKVDGVDRTRALAFDNMSNRAISGTHDWLKCEIVLDVPKEASIITFGALLSGPGQVWFDGMSFEIVSTDVPVTGPKESKKNPGPTNLNFEN